MPSVKILPPGFDYGEASAGNGNGFGFGFANGTGRAKMGRGRKLISTNGRGLQYFPISWYDKVRQTT